MAEAAGLTWHQGWAAWHLGCLAAAASELDDALAYFERALSAAGSIGDPLMAQLLRIAEALILQQRDLRRQREFHRQAYFAAERAEREVAERLRLMLSVQPGGLDELLSAHGWSRTPLMLKLPAPAELPLPAASDGSFWGRLLGVVGLRRRPYVCSASPVELSQLAALDSSSPLELRSAALAGSQLSLDRRAYDLPAPPARGELLLETPVATPQPVEVARGAAEPLGFGSLDERAQAEMAPSLTVYTLGPFRVAVNDQPVESWPSGRGRAVFKYLVAHHDRTLPRDVLMDIFWPDASPEAARNSLNVALHGLRQALRMAADVPVVLFQDGAYRLNPELRLWLDVDEFERRVEAGRRLEAAGQLSAAAAEYEVAAGLYQGDFLAEDPYEEWPVMTCERLRLAYLDTLDRLSQICFGQGQYGLCASLCQRILIQDSCREDAHCRLMRCYSRQRQHHLGLRQYQICVKTLRDELEVEPSPTTTQLYERIRRREQV
jgi:DNA-binding SARP family transcriptional activator